MKSFANSELILNADNSVYHLHLLDEDIADLVIVVGDPARAKWIASFFDSIQLHKANREFNTYTGFYNGDRLTVISSGIGTDNIDILMNELDAAVNIDPISRKIKPSLRQLTIVRIGTSGTLQPSIPVGETVISNYALALDGLFSYYAESDAMYNHPLKTSLEDALNWPSVIPDIAITQADSSLVSKLSDLGHVGITITAPGFYAPQGRSLRLNLNIPSYLEALQTFRWKNLSITNFEMECSALYGFSTMLNHRCATVCLIIANRDRGEFLPSYELEMERLIKSTITQLTT